MIRFKAYVLPAGPKPWSEEPWPQGCLWPHALRHLCIAGAGAGLTLPSHLCTPSMPISRGHGVPQEWTAQSLGMLVLKLEAPRAVSDAKPAPTCGSCVGMSLHRCRPLHTCTGPHNYTQHTNDFKHVSCIPLHTCPYNISSDMHKQLCT